MMRLVVLAGLCALLAVASGAHLGNSTTETSVAGAPVTSYFGVDANDIDAVRKKQSELAQEQWNSLFPGIEPEHVIFNFEDPKTNWFQRGLETARHAINSLIDRIKQAMAKVPHPEESTPTS